ncbi:type VI secretion system membrane subunit TssM [Pseudoduganella sp. FT25W]|uniref:Type VI secretion system membrane subunit TssM n=1 Tax=Duganella alba TaxID=2666081 RepID=A0A6L5QCM7_9BURK|nr:type VI secretion system membrane subunit TssM [Duganella alba]MRX07533.1 type VI secretion system membrane subunit TssM [Duganella alba]MRX15918.1 type VI secretion system membrane subunit TssM [Duganella alba]
MRRIWSFLTDSRNLTIIGLTAVAALFYLGAQVLELALIWALAATAVMLALAGAVWWWRRWRARRESEQLGEAIGRQEPSADPSAAEVKAIRESMLKAIDTIKGSKLGIVSGTRALYELPWYMIIGNPAAGKSTAVTNSGLQFPFADGKVLQGVGGTRNCDWFFTTEGILLDTAGRYSVQEEHRAEWFGFLDLLKKYRRRAPVNGIIIAVSIAELRGDDPETGIKLARSLRKRVQDLIERLEVFAPVYVVFTKADLIAGFGEFFAQAERTERERVWGATMPYQRKTTSQQVMAFFDHAFDELCDGLKAMSLATMGQQRRQRMEPGVFTFPQEFSTIRAPLRSFLVTLFEENPFQFKPVFRGFYFTSALQEGMPISEQSQRITRRFALATPDVPAAASAGHAGFFLLNLFRNVIFADKDLVSQYASRNKVRLKYAAFFAAVLLLGASLGGWSWSYMGNRQLVANVQADLDKVIKLQARRLDLQSRLEALEIIQDRIEQLEKYRESRPWSLRMGLYQGELLERKLREEYFAGVKNVMLTPVVANLETLLSEMNAHAAELQPPGAAAAPVVGRQFQEASPTNVDDAYNALKSYLMLTDKSHAEASHLNDQLPRYWRAWLENNRGAMQREQMIHSAERLMTFYLAQIPDPAWPRIDPKLALVDQARENLRRVVRGMPARERVYADIRARANTRFPAMTVARMVGEQDQALVTGSHAVPGAYTREAWEKFVQDAFRDAANRELQSTDWVLKTAARDDLTLEGSPEQIQKGLTDLYKADYAREWQKFVQGVSIANLNGFDAAVTAMNRLGDPQSSPLSRLLTALHQQTSWDNPTAMSAEVKEAQTGFINWIKYSVLRRSPAQINVNLPTSTADKPMGPVGREFAGIGKLVAAKDKDASLMRAYMDTLSKLRSRLNQLKNQGDPGPGARQFMQQTLEGSGSELADALRYVDEQMLTGMSDTQKQAIRPILVRPLMQTFAVLIGPAEAEINKTWLAQVYEPFQQTLANKYPFSPNARIEAASSEIGQFFGPDGLVAKFATNTLGPLVLRRGDVLAPRTWADMGISLSPQTVQRFPGWIAPISAGGVASTSTAAQTVFQIQPMPAPGTLEYTVEIDGQQLRYRNTPAQWANMVHPSPQGAPGARITAVSFDGRSVDVFNEPGQFGLKRMIDAAAKQKRDGGVFELRWTSGAITVAMGLKIISSPDSSAAASAPQDQGFHGMRLPETIVGAPPAAATPAVASAQAAGAAQ